MKKEMRRFPTGVILSLVVGCGSGGGSDNETTTSSSPNAWGTAILAENDDTGSANPPQIAVGPNGNAFIVWEHWDGTNNNIIANRYTAATNSWGTATLIETDNTGSASHPQIAVDPNGNAFAVWDQVIGVNVNIFFNRYSDSGNSWGLAAPIIINGAGGAVGPQIAVAPNGNALAVWSQSDGTRTNIWANRYTVATNSWDIAATLIETDNGSASSPQIAVAPNGNALAVWSQSDGTRTNIWANRYTVATNSWDIAATLIETDNNGNATVPQIAVDSNGNALVVWNHADDVWANRYTSATNMWGTATSIKTNVGPASTPQIAVAGNGNAFAVWSQREGSRFNIWANHYNAASNSWGAAVLIEQDNNGNATAPQIAAAANGNAFAVWEQSDGVRTNIWANHYNAASNSWGAAVLIENDNTGLATAPQIVVNPNNNAIAVWSQWDGARFNIWANMSQ